MASAASVPAGKTKMEVTPVILGGRDSLSMGAELESDRKGTGF